MLINEQFMGTLFKDKFGKSGGFVVYIPGVLELAPLFTLIYDKNNIQT